MGYSMEAGEKSRVSMLNAELASNPARLRAYKLRTADLNKADKAAGLGAGVLLRLMVLGKLDKASEWGVSTAEAWEGFNRLLRQMREGASTWGEDFGAVKL